MKKRITGIDAARAIAVFGMIIVNFKTVFGSKGSDFLVSTAKIFDGKAAASFVVLAGVGLALMSKTASEKNDSTKLRLIQKGVFKRAAFLFIAGLLFSFIWPADILHYYGIYMLPIIFLLRVRSSALLALSFLPSLIFLVLLFVLDYEKSWNFQTLSYSGFWTLNGFVRNLFFNGFHPVFPWSGFLLFGFWFGRQRLNSLEFLKKAFFTAFLLFAVVQLISVFIPGLFPKADKDLYELFFDTSPMPPMPFYILNGMAFAAMLISGCVWLSRSFKHSKIMHKLDETGRMALTFYAAHIVIGMGAVILIDEQKLGEYSIGFSLAYAVGFSFCCMLFSHLYFKKYNRGPLEQLMRRLTG